MGIEEILGEKREEILRIAARHGVTSIRVFGSVARGEAGPIAMSIFSSKQVPT
jgi:predicted nucleotidyltransferase